MKKFFAIALSLLISAYAYTTAASIRRPQDPSPALPSPEERNRQLQKLYQEIPDLNDKDAVKSYLEKRLKITTAAHMSEEEISTMSSTSIVDPEEIAKKQQQTLSAYEKIHQESMKRIENPDETLNENLELEGTFYRLKQEEAQKFVPDFPYVTIKLSDEKEIMAPAEEHLPYILTSIKIEPTGLLKVTEEFIFVSNNESFPEGFFRILPKYTYSRTGKKRKLDFTLVNVTVNDEEIPYQTTEIGNNFYIEPKKPLNLPTGIYTYRFNYLIDRLVWSYDNFDEFYWDVTGKTLKNVVGSANALVVLPSDKTFLAQNAIASTRNGLNPERVTITALSSNSLGFADTEALAVGEDIHVYITLAKDTLLPPDFTKKYLWFLHDYGAEFFALLALAATIIAYKISLKQIRLNQDKTSARLKKAPALYRLINTNKFDNISFGAEILSLCAKNIFGLVKEEGNVALVKKTDNLKNLTSDERLFIKALFPGSETVLRADAFAELKIKRAYTKLKLSVYKQFSLYKLKLNALYLTFSLTMLLIGIICASLSAVNPLHTFWIIVGFSTLFFAYLPALKIHFKKKIINIPLKIALIFGLVSTGAWLAIYTSPFYAVLMFLSAFVIIYYYGLFSRRSGLLKAKIRETEEYKNYLLKNPQLNIQARDFSTKLPYIFAFELQNSYPNISSLMLIEELIKQFALTSAFRRKQ